MVTAAGTSVATANQVSERDWKTKASASCKQYARPNQSCRKRRQLAQMRTRTHRFTLASATFVVRRASVVELAASSRSSAAFGKAHLQD